MTNSIFIGKYIYYALTESNEVNQYVGFKVFPIVAEQGTEYPFIVYRRNNIQNSENTKDGFNEDSVDFDVIVVSDKYDESIEIANAVRKVLEKKKRVYGDMLITNTLLQGISEDFVENAYVQTLNFSCIVENN
jgi:hypothetical protein